MKFAEFKKSLQEKIEPVYIFLGEDRYLIDTCIKNLTSACEIEFPDLNLSTFNENASFDDVLLACETMPFMDKLRLVVVKDIELNEDKKTKLTKYAKNPNKSVCLAISVKGETKELSGTTLVDCNKLDANLLRKKILADLKPKGYLIGDEALKVLISYCDFSLTQINNELEKLMSYAGENKVITEAMIKTLSVKDTSYNIFEFTEALGRKKSDDALKSLDYLLTKEEPIALIGLLYGYFRRLLMVALSPNDLDNATIASQLLVKPYAISVARQQCKLFSAKRLLALCEKLKEIDYKLKNTFTQAKNELYSFVFSALN